MMNEFEKFNLSKEVINDLTDNGITKPTLVQAETIPLILNNKDVLVQSETGSGKTIGFAAPTIERVKHGEGVKVLVLTPTRELAKQIGDEYKKFSASKQLVISVIYGGIAINDQMNDLIRADIVVGTPGRVLDLINRRLLNLREVNYLILDEADRLMDMGFIDDIDRIISYLPKKRQSLLFSATINNRVIRLAERYLNNPEEVLLNNLLKKGVLEQYYYNIEEHRKLSLLVHLLKKAQRELSIVFCNTKRRTNFVAEVLRVNGINAACLNGDMTQHMREKVMKSFINEQVKVLVATDVAARGLHVDNITHVINYDLHDDLENYTHRIGRTARNGARGTAIILLSPNDWTKMTKIMRKYSSQINEKPTERYERIRIPQRRIN